MENQVTVNYNYDLETVTGVLFTENRMRTVDICILHRDDMYQPIGA